jgi:hypothetical protein
MKILARAAVLAVLISTVLALSTSTALSQSQKKTAAATNPQKVAGQWVRLDGGYILELKDIKKDGSLTALYFNPRPIHVGKAELQSKGGMITLLVELRDVNYPGSIYNLRFDSERDMLLGTYYQAVDRETFTVAFARKK